MNSQQTDNKERPSMAELLPFWQEMRGHQPFVLSLERTAEVASLDALWAELEALNIADGWLSTTAEVVALDAGRLRRTELAPLWAELNLGAGRSLHLRHLDGERYRLDWIARRDDPNGVGEVREFFARGAASRRGKLRYEVSWALCDDVYGQAQLRPHLARFAGFVAPNTTTAEEG